MVVSCWRCIDPVTPHEALLVNPRNHYLDEDDDPCLAGEGLQRRVRMSVGLGSFRSVSSLEGCFW
jgi:hypothetical protein